MSRNISQSKRQMIFARDAWTCVYCGVEGVLTTLKVDKPHRTIIRVLDDNGEQYEIDHLIPIKLKGSNSFENLVTACAPCNSKKSSNIVKPNYYFYKVKVK